MKLFPFSSISTWTAFLLTCALGMSGCAQGGHGIATGNCAGAIICSATITVSPELRLSLGDSAIESASRAMGLYPEGIHGKPPALRGFPYK